MPAPKGNQNAKGKGRLGYGLEQREKRLREMAMAHAEELIRSDFKSAAEKLMTPQQFETYITVLKRALKQRTDVTTNDKDIQSPIPILGGATRR